ncbi:uroporphyrinogen-III C-methyltransferase [Rhodopseudomonas pseudopalustris]|uniref:uroporphyrinogen-III C-methyltransferase n=2 Tax=Rhodopseudomonas TaxID=1073 RepID=Q138E5_RHOPS|nr:uroporphyrinogen-III C-methyltransferase [Rhodopseudomonas pseudopalustris]ABE39544.1 uroporphyrinogen-III C-methyltransferase [Rhodopseudomonas palustris BisB5]SEP16541.1 uroporphyrinogen-III C-methyltransferase [Rhodopseudomonas pseudopalustris]
MPKSSDHHGAGATGSIALVGAGPGDADLLTLRAIKRLQTADIVLYDDLAGEDFMAYLHPDAELIAVGKRAGHPSPRQDEVSRLAIAHALLGKNVVRLKAGDPTLFARADEELRAARDAGIAVEIVPGITTATAAAAAIGASLTKRGVARRVQFVTGHDVDGRLPRDLDLAALADPTATTCVYMGKATFPGLTEQLIAHGLSAATPAVIVESLGSETTKILRGTIAEIAARLTIDRPSGPCIILYGAALAEA